MGADVPPKSRTRDYRPFYSGPWPRTLKAAGRKRRTGEFDLFGWVGRPIAKQAALAAMAVALQVDKLDLKIL